MLKCLISSGIFFMSSGHIVASAENDKVVDYSTVVRSFDAAKQSLAGLDSLITPEEFQKISATRIGGNAIPIFEIVYFVFLKKICSISSDRVFWKLGGEIFYEINDDPIVFESLVLDSSSVGRKPVIKVYPQDHARDVKEISFNDIKKIVFYIDNNVVLQNTILNDFYSISGVFSGFDYGLENTLRELASRVVGTTVDVVQRQQVPQNWLSNNDFFFKYYQCVCEHNLVVDGVKVFKDSWEWEKAAEHGYEKHTQLLWVVDLNEDHAKKLYELCSSPSFFDSLARETGESNVTVDLFNFFPEVLTPGNETIFRELVANRGLADFRVVVNPVSERVQQDPQRLAQSFIWEQVDPTIENNCFCNFNFLGETYSLHDSNFGFNLFTSDENTTQTQSPLRDTTINSLNCTSQEPKVIGDNTPKKGSFVKNRKNNTTEEDTGCPCCL